MILFLVYYIIGCLLFLIWAKVSKKTQEALRGPFPDFETQFKFLILVWVYPLLWPADVIRDLYRYYVKKVPLEDL